MKRKYIIHGGYVISQADGQEHYIEPRRVMELYKVKRNDCYLELAEGHTNIVERGPHAQTYVHLYPDPSGEYCLPGIVAPVPGLPDK